jgi:radical SAM protein with 4Fe4S-binding SPASM domain
LPELDQWQRLEDNDVPVAFDIELTARCNNDCRHCYINLAPNDRAARAAELTLDEIVAVADQAVECGALWCTLTGGEPLLRGDFHEVYLALKKRGLLVSVFTNACLIRPRDVELFRAYPPRDIEITIYGATRETYERVTRIPGSFDAFLRGVALLEAGGVAARYKATVLRSNVHELDAMASFGRAHTKDYFRFDAQLHLRYDGDARRNAEIRAERVTPDEATVIERSDPERLEAVRDECRWAARGAEPNDPALLFRCGVTQSFTVGHEGSLRLCSSLWHPDFVADVRREPLADAHRRLTAAAVAARAHDDAYAGSCGSCRLANLCLWCPAHAYLETGSLSAFVEEFCADAHARADAAGEDDAGSPDPPMRRNP